MANFLISSSVTLPPSVPAATAIRSRVAFFHPSRVPIPLTLRFARRETSRLPVATRAIPAANSLALAFLLPLSLVIATIFVSIRIADKLDDDYLADLALSQALEEAGDGDGEDVEEEDGVSKPKPMEEPALPRTRNRPKRAPENSSVL